MKIFIEHQNIQDMKLQNYENQLNEVRHSVESIGYWIRNLMNRQDASFQAYPTYKQSMLDYEQEIKSAYDDLEYFIKINEWIKIKEKGNCWKKIFPLIL